MRYGLLFAVTASIIVAGGLIGVALFDGGLALDFDVFWRAAHASAANVYNSDGWQPFVYPPTAVPWLKPLVLMSFWPAFAIWTLLSLCLFFPAAALHAPISHARRWFMLLSPALIECVAFGQTSLIVSSVLLFACSRQGWLRGALLALALSLKPQVLVMAPLVLVVRRDWPAIVGAAVTGALLVLTTLALYGPIVWQDWLHALPNFSRVLDERNLYWALITPYGLARWAGLPGMPFWIAGMLLSLFAVLRSARHWDELAMPIAVTSILAVPYAVPHDLVAALPWCASVLLRREPRWQQAPAALIFSAVFVPVATAALAFSWLRLTPRRVAIGASVEGAEPLLGSTRPT